MKTTKGKILICSILGIFLFLGVTPSTQAQAYEKGDKLLNIGIGLNSYYSSGIPLNASFEVGVTDDISVGGSLDYLSSKYTILNDYKFTAIYIGARGSYHFNKLLNLNSDKVDLYGGLGLGYRSFSWSDGFTSNVLGDSYGSGIYFGLHIGGKYYFSESIGGFAELGATGATNARLGVAFKF